MSLQVVLPRIDFTTAGSRTAETAGTGPRTAFHLAGVSLAGVENLKAGHLAGGLADGGSVELLLAP